MRRSIEGQVVVITGASSGIGHATALELARRGATLVLTARSQAALESVAEEIAERGGRAIALAADVSKPDELKKLADRAIAEFGRIDCWINNASVAVWATIDAMSIEDVDRVIAVDLLGVIYGVKAVLPQMLFQGSGTIINVASVLGERSIPLLSTYSAAKHGVKGFTESLRMEVKGRGIDVVLVLPSAINTPFYTWGKSRMGVRPDPVSMVYDPRVVARAIAGAIEKPRRDVYVGSVGKALSIAQRLSPRAVDYYMTQRRRMFTDQITSIPDRGESNLDQSSEATEIDGIFESRARKRSFYTEMAGSRKVKTAVTVAALTGAALLLFKFVKPRK